MWLTLDVPRGEWHWSSNWAGESTVTSCRLSLWKSSPGVIFHEVFPGLSTIWSFQPVVPQFENIIRKHLDFSPEASPMTCHGWDFNIFNVMVPPNHQFLDGIFHEINHLFWGTHIYGKTHIWSINVWLVYDMVLASGIQKAIEDGHRNTGWW